MESKYKNLGKVRPTVEGDWDISKDYELLSIVYNEESNKSYISKTNVPKGISITNKNYWSLFGNNRIDSDSILLLSKNVTSGNIDSFTLKEAIDSISKEDARVGLFISFYEKPTDDSNMYRWNLYQFNSVDVNDFYDVTAWSSVYYNKTKFYGLFANKDLLYSIKKNPNIGDYAFVGNTLGESVIYRCDIKNIWKKTTEKAVDYLSIILKDNITIGSNGNWFQNGVDTGIPAQGPKGDKPYLRFNDSTGNIEYSFDNVNWNILINKDKITGADATIEIGTVTTLPAGSSASVTNSGNKHGAIFNFGIPKGDKGDQGNSGVSGTTDNIVVINNLNGGESTPEQIKVLAAEQGKVLNEKLVKLENLKTNIEVFSKEAVLSSNENVTASQLYESIKGLYCDFTKDGSLYYSFSNIENDYLKLWSNSEKDGSGSKTEIDKIKIKTSFRNFYERWF